MNKDASKIRRAVVTGPTGAVGIALIQELIIHGIEVVAVPREGSLRLGAFRKIRMFASLSVP